MEKLIQMMFGLVIIIFAIAITIYIIQGILLNKLNKLMYGKGTPMAWIPIANIYLLGKLTVNKIVGWILITCIFLTSKFTITVNGIEKSYTILPESINSIIYPLYSLTIIGLVIYAIVKYFKLKKNVQQNNLANTNNINNQNTSSLNTQTQYNNINTNDSLNDSNANTNIAPQITNQNIQNNICTNCGCTLLPNTTFCTNCGKQI